MIKNFSVLDNLGDIVAIYPGAGNFFMDKKIDFCCGGNRTLLVAINEGNLDEEDILNSLNNSYKEFQEKNEEFTDWVKESPGKLIEFIKNTHHGYLKRELPVISELLFKILKVHGKTNRELFRVHKLFNNLKTELEEHLVKEEEFLFPEVLVYAGDKTSENREKLVDLLEELEKEHTGAGDIIKELREVTNHYTLPGNACTTYALTYRKLKELEKDLFLHIHLENNILFKNL